MINVPRWVAFAQHPCGLPTAAGALGGRLDHVLSSLNTLYKHKGRRVLLCGDGNLVRLLPTGQTRLAPDRAVEGPSCGLVALGAPATASSSGLKWNLGAWNSPYPAVPCACSIHLPDDRM